MIQADVPQQALSKQPAALNRQGQPPQSAWDGAKVILDGDITLFDVPTFVSPSGFNQSAPHPLAELLLLSRHKAGALHFLPPSISPESADHQYLLYPPRLCRHKPASPNLVSYVAEVSAYPIPFFPPSLSLTVFLLHLGGDSILC